MNSAKQSYLISRGVIALSVLVAVIIGVLVWDINPWPTDAEVFYMPAALRLPYVSYLSDIHTTEGLAHIRWLHGKELYVVAISVFQFLLNDFYSLRPLMLVGLVAVAVSSILIFYIARKLWDLWVAVFLYLAFVFCVWPYIYILFAKHQTLGLMFFLIAVLLLFNMSKVKFRYVWPFLSGVAVGMAFYSTTVCSLFMPFYAAVFFMVVWGLALEQKNRIKNILGAGFLVIAGFLPVFIYANLPDIIGNIKKFIEYIHISGAYNHFYYNQLYLQQWFPNQNVGEVRGGWIWIFKYLFLVLPVMFPLYLLAVSYLVVRIVREKDKKSQLIFAGVILLSLCPAIMAEKAKVAQYGANYFPLLIGVWVIIGFALQDLGRRLDVKRVRSVFLIIASGVLIIHAAVNTYIFIDDVYVPRMATTFLSDKIKELGIERLATYRTHFHRNHFAFCLNAKLREKIGWVAIQSLGQLEAGGYVLVPPPTGDSIFVASSTSYNNYDKDIVLVQLIRRNLLKDVSVASFKTMINSRLWRQEEEILSYRYLVLGQPLPDERLGRVWLVDAQKVKALEKKLIPTLDEMRLLKGDINNIGTAEKFYIFEGQRLGVTRPIMANRAVCRILIKGDPNDELILSVFTPDPKEPIWLPIGKHFTSKPLKASELKQRGDKALTSFTFDPPLNLKEGVYYFQIYRTGKADDKNYYQVDNQHFAVQ